MQLIEWFVGLIGHENVWEACEGFAHQHGQTRPYTRRAARPPSAPVWTLVILFSIQMSCILQFARVPDSGKDML